SVAAHAAVAASNMSNGPGAVSASPSIRTFGPCGRPASNRSPPVQSISTGACGVGGVSAAGAILRSFLPAGRAGVEECKHGAEPDATGLALGRPGGQPAPAIGSQPAPAPRVMGGAGNRLTARPGA